MIFISDDRNDSVFHWRFPNRVSHLTRSQYRVHSVVQIDWFTQRAPLCSLHRFAFAVASIRDQFSAPTSTPYTTFDSATSSVKISFKHSEIRAHYRTLDLLRENSMSARWLNRQVKYVIQTLIASRYYADRKWRN